MSVETCSSIETNNIQESCPQFTYRTASFRSLVMTNSATSRRVCVCCKFTPHSIVHVTETNKACLEFSIRKQAILCVSVGVYSTSRYINRIYGDSSDLCFIIHYREKSKASLIFLLINNRIERLNQKLHALFNRRKYLPIVVRKISSFIQIIMYITKLLKLFLICARINATIPILIWI